MDEKQFATNLIKQLEQKGIGVFRNEEDIWDAYNGLAIINNSAGCWLVDVFPGDFFPRQISELVTYPFEVEL